MTSYNSEADVTTKLTELERRMDALERSSRLQATGVGDGGLNIHDGGTLALEDGGLITVKDGGEIECFSVAASTTPVRNDHVYWMGDIYDEPDLTTYIGTGIYGQHPVPHGTTPSGADSFGAFTNNVDYHQVFITTNDSTKSTNVFGFAVLATERKGLTYPPLNSGVGPKLSGWMPSTTTSGFQAMWSTSPKIYHQTINVGVGIITAGSAIGQVRVMISPDNATWTQLGSTFSYNGGTLGKTVITGANPFAVGTRVYINVESQIGSGTGTVYCTTSGLVASG